MGVMMRKKLTTKADELQTLGSPRINHKIPNELDKI
jgi:hypothetical protein